MDEQIRFEIGLKPTYERAYCASMYLLSLPYDERFPPAYLGHTVYGTDQPDLPLAKLRVPWRHKSVSLSHAMVW